MVTGTHRDTVPVQYRTDVVRVDSFDYEREHARLGVRGADESHALDCRYRVSCGCQQLSLVRGDCLEPDFRQVFDCGSEPDCAGDVWRPRLEP